MLRSWHGCMIVGALAGCGTSAMPTEGPHRFSSDVIVEDSDLEIDRGNVYLSSGSDASVAPEVVFTGARGSWRIGMDVANNGGSRDFVLAAKNDWPQPGDVQDLVYVAHNDQTAPTVGVGVTPPSTQYRFQVSAQDDQPDMGTLLLRRTPDQVGNLLTVLDSGGVARWWLDSNLWLQGQSPFTAASIAIKADDANQRPLILGRSDGSTVYGFEYAADQPATLNLKYITAGAVNMSLNTSGVPNFPNGLTTSGLRVNSAAPPATSTSPCTRGDLQFDDQYVYVCIAANTWKRAALESW